MDTGRQALLTPIAVRLLLARAATVDEAVSLLGQYDIQTGHGWTQHLFIADAEGDSAVVEWHKDKMKVVKSPVCTDFRMSAKTLDGDYSGQCDRFDILRQALEEHPENTAEDSMELLEAVKQEDPGFNIFTECSVVYDLAGFTDDYVVNMDYDKVYHLDPRDF